MFRCMEEGVLSVKIYDIKVPSTYVLDQEKPEPLVLDCIYDVDPSETGFVLKWLLNDQSVYQWIPSHGPFALPMLKSRIDATYEASQDGQQRHRALAIIKPSWNITGNYTCSVQTFQSSDRRSAHLQVIVPERDFQLKHHCCDEEDNVDIVCNTLGIFPEPKLSVLLNDVSVNNLVGTRSKVDDDGLFEVTATARVPRQRLESPTTIRCILSIPGTTYTRRKESIFYDRLTFVPTAMSLDKDTSARSYLDIGSGAASVFTKVLLPFIVLLLHWT
ncbi:uncharacterized protein DMENIID0001_040750 [Sergentomyia squamirostris]